MQMQTPQTNQVETAPRILTPREAANLLRLSYKHTLDLCKANKLPHFWIGSRVRFFEADLIEYLRGLRDA